MYTEKSKNYQLKLKNLEEQINNDAEDNEDKKKKIQKASNLNVGLKADAESKTLVEKEKS